MSSEDTVAGVRVLRRVPSAAVAMASAGACLVLAGALSFVPEPTVDPFGRWELRASLPGRPLPEELPRPHMTTGLHAASKPV